MTAPRDWRYGSAVKSIYCSSRGREIGSHSHVKRLTTTCSTPVLGEGSHHFSPWQALALTCTNLHRDSPIHTIKHKQTKQDPGMGFGRKRQQEERAMQDTLSNGVLRARALIETSTQFQVCRTKRAGAGGPSLEEPQRTLEA